MIDDLQLLPRRVALDGEEVHPVARLKLDEQDDATSELEPDWDALLVGEVDFHELVQLAREFPRLQADLDAAFPARWADRLDTHDRSGPWDRVLDHQLGRTVVPQHEHVLDRLALRSEEHTSELQSLAYLVCRLLLEKKKKTRVSTRLYISAHMT